MKINLNELNEYYHYYYYYYRIIIFIFIIIIITTIIIVIITIEQILYSFDIRGQNIDTFYWFIYLCSGSAQDASGSIKCSGKMCKDKSLRLGGSWRGGGGGRVLIPFPRKLFFSNPSSNSTIPACVAQIEIPFPFFYCFFFSWIPVPVHKIPFPSL